MIFHFGGFVAAFVASFVLTFFLRGAALRLGMVDRPDGGRKAHARPTPNVGGVGIFLGAAAALLLGIGLGAPTVLGSAAQMPVIGALAVGATLIFLLGLVDDIRGLGPWTKLLVQLIVAVGLVSAGVRIDSFGPVADGGIAVPALIGVPLTVFWIVGITNSFNLLDGSDGVAGGAALFALLTVGGISLLFGKDPVAAVAFVMAGATLGFLFFNFPPATIFMGDSGSLLLGFTLASMGVIATQKAPTVLAIAIPLAAFGVPIMDTSLAILRRFLRRDRIFRPDRGHIHHRLRDLGHSPRAVAITVYMLTAALCVFSLLLAGGQTALVGLGFVVVGAILVIFVQRLRIPELLELGKLVHWGRLQRVVIERNMRVKEAGERLAQAATGDDIVEALKHAFGDGEFTRLELWLEDRYACALLGERWVEGTEERCCLQLGLSRTLAMGEVELRLPLSLKGRHPAGRLTLFRPVDGTRILTDLTVIVSDLEPALLRALEAVAERAEPVAIPAASGTAGSRAAGEIARASAG